MHRKLDIDLSLLDNIMSSLFEILVYITFSAILKMAKNFTIANFEKPVSTVLHQITIQYHTFKSFDQIREKKVK